jgi:hypothetical protein
MHTLQASHGEAGGNCVPCMQSMLNFVNIYIIPRANNNSILYLKVKLRDEVKI